MATFSFSQFSSFAGVSAAFCSSALVSPSTCLRQPTFSPTRRSSPRRFSARLFASSSLLLFLLLSCTSPAQVGARTISVPDLHGDYERGISILQHAGLIEPANLDHEDKPLWIGGDAKLVQTGDMVDRGDHGRELYLMFQRLHKEAKEAGGEVVNLLGNHELMNLQEDLRYVTDGDVAEFGGMDERKQAWSEEGWLGSWVRTFPALAKVDNVLFSHAGLPLKFLEGEHTLDDVNDGIAMAISPGNANERGKALMQESSFSQRALLGDSGPLWTRFYSKRGNPSMCSVLREVLERTGAHRMVVGHTIQYSSKDGFKVRPDCGGRLLLADTAVSRAYRGVPSYIEHDGEGGAVAVYPSLGTKEPLNLEL